MPANVQTIPPYQSSFSAYTNRIANTGISLYSESHCGKSSGNGGGKNMESRIARLESDVSYIKRDIGEIKDGVKSVDTRLSKIETSITVIKVSGAIISAAFALCAYIFGGYASAVLKAVNALVLKQ